MLAPFSPSSGQPVVQASNLQPHGPTRHRLRALWARAALVTGPSRPEMARVRTSRRTDPTSPSSPPLTPALWRMGGGLVWTTVSKAGDEGGGDGTLGSVTEGLGLREPAGDAERRGPPRTCDHRLCPARPRYNAVGCREVALYGSSFHRPYTCSLRRFELSRYEARTAKACAEAARWQEASRGTP
mgnify:CR=1 FL=1